MKFLLAQITLKYSKKWRETAAAARVFAQWACADHPPMLDTVKSTHYTKKCFKKKLLSIKFRTKNLVGASVYLPQDGARGSKDCHHWNIIMFWNVKVDSLYGSLLPKIRIISKNASNVTWRNKRCQPSQNEFSCNAALKLQTRISHEWVIYFSWNLVALLVDAFCIVLQSVIFFVIF